MAFIPVPDQRNRSARDAINTGSSQVAVDGPPGAHSNQLRDTTGFDDDQTHDSMQLAICSACGTLALSKTFFRIEFLKVPKARDPLSTLFLITTLYAAMRPSRLPQSQRRFAACFITRNTSTENSFISDFRPFAICNE
jgi:hypothetical protein